MRHLVLLLLLAFTVRADEPLWTEAERTALRACVIDGKVLKVETVKPLAYASLMRAEVQILNVSKSHPSLPPATVVVFFEYSPTGSRCPDYAHLKIGETARLHLGHHSYLTGQPAFTLEMASDITVLVPGYQLGAPNTK